MKTNLFVKALGVAAAGLITLTGISSFARGGEAGGGGGGIVINGKVYTLAQAGLTIAAEDKEDTNYYLDPETIAATKKLLSKVESILPSNLGMEERLLLRRAVFSNSHVYRKIDVVDQKLFEGLKEEYRKYVQALPDQGGQFVLAAFTNGLEQRTDLFPDFFAADANTRAIYLLHEAAFIITPKIPLKNVLEFEIALVRVDRAATPEAIYQFDKAFEGICWDKITYLHSKLPTLFIKSLLDRGIRLKLSDFLDPDVALDDRNSRFCSPVSSSIYGDNISVDNQFVKLKKNIHPEFSNVAGMRIDFEMDDFSWQDSYKSDAYIPKVCNFKNLRPDNFVFRSIGEEIVIEPIDKTIRPGNIWRRGKNGTPAYPRSIINFYKPTE